MKKVINTLNIWFATPFGSIVQLFLIACLVYVVESYIEDTDILKLDKETLKKVLKAGAIAIAKVLFDYRNRHFTQFGRRKR